MAITDITTATEVIQNKLGDQDAETLAPIILVLWTARADKNLIVQGLQFEYTMRDTADVLLGQLWPQVTTATGDLKESLDKKYSQVQEIRDNSAKEIIVLESRAAASRPPVVAQITQTAPVAPWPGKWPWKRSPNDPAYAGSAVRDSLRPEGIDYD